MTMRVAVQITCDICREVKYPHDGLADVSDSYVREAKSRTALRKSARYIGWVFKKGHDICPSCNTLPEPTVRALTKPCAQCGKREALKVRVFFHRPTTDFAKKMRKRWVQLYYPDTWLWFAPDDGVNGEGVPVCSPYCMQAFEDGKR